MDHYRQMKRSHKIIVGFVFLLAIVFIVLPPYAYKALWYGMPGIDDYKIFNNRIIKAGEYQPWQISEEYNKIKLSDELSARIAEFDPVAFLVIKDEKIVYEDYWDGYDMSSLSNSFSAAKSIVGLAIGAAVDDGFIKNLDQKAADFIPSFREGKKRNISIRDLLTMSSGLDWDESYASLFSPTTQSYYGNNLIEMINAREVIKKPGQDHYYSSIDTQILALIIQNATGFSFSEYVSRKFWQHMGPYQDALWSLDVKGGMEKAYCCFNSNARDFARWGQLILNNGSWNNRQLVSNSYIEQMVSPAEHLVDDEGNKVDYYGFQWWIINYKNREIPYMRGILGQYVFALEDKNAVVVRLGHKRSDELVGPNRKDIFVYLDAAYYILDNLDQ